MKYRYKLGKESYETAQTTAAAILLLPTLAALYFLFISPVVRVFALSFTSTNTITGQSTYIGLRNYTYLLGNQIFKKSFFNTWGYTLGKLSFEITLSLLLAVLLDANVPWRKYLRVCYFVPVIVPVVASSIIWMWLYDPVLGPLNQVLKIFGLPTSNYIFAQESALGSIVAYAVWRGLGYDIIIFLSGLQGIPDTVVEAAHIDGANERQVLLRVKLPLLRPIIMFVIMMGLIGCFRAFTEVDIMTQGGPNNSTLLMVNYIYKQAFGNAKMGRGAAASVLLFAVIFMLTLAQKLLNERKERKDG